MLPKTTEIGSLDTVSLLYFGGLDSLTVLLELLELLEEAKPARFIGFDYSRSPEENGFSVAFWRFDDLLYAMSRTPIYPSTAMPEEVQERQLAKEPSRGQRK